MWAEDDAFGKALKASARGAECTFKPYVEVRIAPPRVTCACCPLAELNVTLRSSLVPICWFRCLTGGAAVAMLPTRRSGVMSNSSWPIPKLSSPSTWDSSRTKAVQHVKMGGALESNGYWWSKSCAPSCPRNSKAALSVYRLSLSAIPISNRIYKYKPKTEPKSEDRRRRVHASTLSVRHARESLLLQILLIRVSSVVLV